jgi:hypothetical protein
LSPPSEHNPLINPARQDFRKITIREVEPLITTRECSANGAIAGIRCCISAEEPRADF